jgi:hypothetical protein
VRRIGSSTGARKLHSIWDGLLGTGANFNGILHKANQLIADHPSEFNMPFVALPNDVWTTEGQQLALAHAYGPILSELRQTEHSSGALGTVDVPESYFAEAGELAGRQAVIAGARLAGLMTSILSTPPAPSPLAAQELDFGFPIAIGREAAADAPSAPHRAMREPTSMSEMLSRIEQLESEVRSIRAQLQRLNGEVGRTESPHFDRLDAVNADSGVQCDCGEED